MAQFTVNIPQQYVDRIQAVLKPGVTLDAQVLQKAILRWLTMVEYRKFQIAQSQTYEGAVRQKANALEDEGTDKDIV